VAVLFYVRLGCFRRVVRRMVQVPLRAVRVVSRSLVLPRFVMCRRFPMMSRCVFVVLRCLVMMIRRFFRHGVLHANRFSVREGPTVFAYC
jgi:hypothetical protein